MNKTLVICSGGWIQSLWLTWFLEIESWLPLLALTMGNVTIKNLNMHANVLNNWLLHFS